MASLKAIVVAGWWGWWGQVWGWWWAGWYVYDSAHTVTPWAYTVTIGDWWAWWVLWTSPYYGSNWQNSVFDTITAVWGWGWQWWTGSAGTWGRNWGSWGWGWWFTATSWGSATQGNSWGGTGYGNAWGNWPNGVEWCAGWWWAWAAGANVTSSDVGTAWGIGRINDIAWSTAGQLSWGNYYLAWWWWWCANAWIAWAWGLGWGWAWVLQPVTPWWDGTANTWGWGWGRRWDTAGRWGNWGSWVVVLAYATDGSDWISTNSTWGTVTTSWALTIHTFTTSGTFTMVAAWWVTASFLYLMV